MIGCNTKEPWYIILHTYVHLSIHYSHYYTVTVNIMFVEIFLLKYC